MTVNDLFTTGSMEPMIFSLGSCPLREMVEEMIELGGGLLENPKYPDKTGRRINLMAKNDNRVIDAWSREY
jgi:hypothetical protein